jgi:hypothetical protein
MLSEAIAPRDNTALHNPAYCYAANDVFDFESAG